MVCSKKKAGGGLFGLVLIGGLILAFLNLAVGIGFSIRVPLTNLSLSCGGSLGKKEVVSQALPNYLQNRIVSNNDFMKLHG